MKAALLRLLTGWQLATSRSEPINLPDDDNYYEGAENIE